MHDDLELPDPDGEGDMPPEVEELLAATENLEDEMRKIGLYMEESVVMRSAHPDAPPEPVLAVQFAIGDIAFATRTQDPEADSIDRQFREMTTNMQNDEFLEVREKMKRNMQEGKDPFDGLEDGHDG